MWCAEEDVATNGWPKTAFSSPRPPVLLYKFFPSFTYKIFERQKKILVNYCRMCCNEAMQCCPSTYAQLYRQSSS